jgi:hypothetical protein
MSFEIYKVVKEEKIAEVAAKFETTVEEIKRLNPDVRYFTAFFGPEYISALQDVRVPAREIAIKELTEETQLVVGNLSFTNEARYRCEQTVVTKINGIVQNHADTKTEFIVGKQETKEGLFIKIQMTDTIVQMYPDQMEETIMLVNDIENVKSDAIFLVSPNTGKIRKVINHHEIIFKWKKHLEYLQNKYDYIRSEEARENLERFIEMAGDQILAESNLILDYESKLFHQIFFDKYLVTDQDLLEPYIITFYSQLFTGLSVPLEFRQDLISEQEHTIGVRKVGDMPKNYDHSKQEQMYNDKFLPLIKYKFSEFNFSYRQRDVINTTDKWIESADVTMIEQVKNNIQILIDYKLKKIEL